MRIRVRPYETRDTEQVVDVYRDAYDVLRASGGGQHPDRVVEAIQGMSNESLLDRVLEGYALFVAEEVDTDRLIGIGAVSNRRVDRWLRSARSKSHYVRAAAQGGQKGVGVGSLLRAETLAYAKDLGCRKVWGYAQPESRRWHEKFGARLYPRHNTVNPEHSLRVHYYEIVLRESLWNSVRIEPCIFRITKFLRSLGLERSPS